MNSADLQGNKNQLCFYTQAMNNLKNEIKKAVSFTVASKRVKYQGKHLTKEVNDLNTENY